MGTPRRGRRDGLGAAEKESGRAREFSGHAFHRTFLTVPPDNKVSVHTTASILDCGAEPASAANRTLTFSTRTMFPDDIPRLTMFKKRRNKSHGRGHSATEDTQASVCTVAVWFFSLAITRDTFGKWKKIVFYPAKAKTNRICLKKKGSFIYRNGASGRKKQQHGKSGSS